MDQSKVEVILQLVEPKNIKKLKGFLRLSGYYRRFINNYATIASPIVDLLKKDSLLWSNTGHQAFSKLKWAIATTPFLKLPDFTQIFILETTAFGYEIRAILNQNNITLLICLEN